MRVMTSESFQKKSRRLHVVTDRRNKKMETTYSMMQQQLQTQHVAATEAETCFKM